MGITLLITFPKVVRVKAYILVYEWSSLYMNLSPKDNNVFLRASLLVPRDLHFSTHKNHKHN